MISFLFLESAFVMFAGWRIDGFGFSFLFCCLEWVGEPRCILAAASSFRV